MKVEEALLEELYGCHLAENYYERQQANHSTALVVIAALNEEEGIGPTIRELRNTLDFPRILVVDGHSRDRTVEVAKDLGADVIFQGGLGKGDAISKALELTQTHTCEHYVVLTDADFTYPAMYVPGMIKILDEDSEVGMVCGNRFNGSSDSEAFRSEFYLGNKLLAFVHGFLNGVTLRDPLTGMRVIRAELLKNCAVKSKGFDIEVELNSFVHKQGYKTVEVPIQYRQRLGEKKLKMKHGAEILGRMITEAML